MTHPTTKRLFRTLWRFNAMAIALASVVVLCFGAVAGVLLVRDIFRARSVASIVALPQPSAPGASQQPMPVKLEALHFTTVAGHDVMWSAMTSHETIAGSYYDKDATNTRDMLFYDPRSGQYRRLVGRDDWLIATSRFITRSDAPPMTATAASGSHGPPATETAVALLVMIVEADTNADGRLSQSDTKVVALARPDGTGLVRIARDVDRLVGHAVVADGPIIVMVRDAAGSTRALRIGISDFGVVREDRFGPQAAGAG